MNVRRPVDYCAMFMSLGTFMAMAANLPQIKLYQKIDKLVSSRVGKASPLPPT